MKTTVIVNKYGMGEAPQELGLTLVTNYFNILSEEQNLPSFICFYAEGARLCLEGSPVIDALRILESRGVKILICKTCLSYYQALDKVAAGTVGTMLDIMGAQMNCDKVIVL